MRFMHRPNIVLFAVSVVFAVMSCSDPAPDDSALPGGDGGDGVSDTGSDRQDSAFDRTAEDLGDVRDGEVRFDLDGGAEDGPTSCSLSAQVRTDDGEPLVGARIELEGPEHAAGTTNELGRIDLELTCGNYDATVSEFFGVGQGLPDIWGWPLAQGIEVSGAEPHEWWIELATVGGRVLEEDGGTVPGSVRVEARLESGEASVFNRTDVDSGDGTYELVLPVHGTWTYTITPSVLSPGRTYQAIEEELLVQEDVEVSFTLIEIVPCIWSGEIRSSESVVFGRATFEIEGLAAPDLVFNGDGTFEASLPCATYAITTSQPARGDQTRPYLVNYRRGEPIVLTTDDDTGLEIPVVSLSGDITAAGEAVDGVRVTAGAIIDGGGRVEGTTTSGVDGKYRMSIPPLAAEYTLTFRVPSGAGLEQPESVQLLITDATVRDLALTQIPICPVNGHVALLSGTKIADVGVQFSGTADSAFFNADSTGAFSGQVNCGTYDVSLFAAATSETPGFDAWIWREDLALTEASTLDEGIASAEVSGRVQDTLGNNLAGVTVGAFNANRSASGAAITDEDGRYSLTVVPDAAQDYLFDIVAVDQPYAVQREIAERVADDTTVDFFLAPLIPCTLTATLETSEGMGLADTEMRFAGDRAQDGEDVSFSLTTDGDGLLDESVDCGDYEVSVAFLRGPGAVGGDEYPLTADPPNANGWVIDEDFGIEGNVEHLFVLDVAVVTGTTRTVRGEPIADVRLDFVLEGAAGVRAWNRVQSDSSGSYSVPLVRSAELDYVVTATPPEELALPPVVQPERIAIDRELNFHW